MDSLITHSIKIVCAIYLVKRNYELTCKMEPHQMPFTDLCADSVQLHGLDMKKISNF